MSLKEADARHKILFIVPELLPGRPVSERVRAFIAFFEREGFACQNYKAPASLAELLILTRYIYANGFRRVFITMPPFRNWSVCLLPRVRTILDLRDGWSIAMRTGYGGAAKPNRLKSFIARIIEQIAIRASTLTITCTPGLVRYHSTLVAKKKLALIPNGFPDEEFSLVQKLKQKISVTDRRRDEKIFICAGKFGEYGIDKAKNILTNISNYYNNELCIVNIFGSDEKKNEWIDEFIQSKKITNLKVNIFKSIPREVLINEILMSDYGISLVRDESYEFGTKIFDYIACRLEVFDLSNSNESFFEYFRNILDNSTEDNVPDYIGRKKLININREKLIGALEL